MKNISDDLKFWRRQSIPVLLQSEASECGLACLAMIASYWGYRVDLAYIRRRFNVSLKGLSLHSLVGIAHELKFLSRALKVPLNELNRLATPCILHWDLTHFVVMTKSTRTTITIHDPAVGKRIYSIQECSKHYTGIALELRPGNDFRKIEALKAYSLNLPLFDAPLSQRVMRLS